MGRGERQSQPLNLLDNISQSRTRWKDNSRYDEVYEQRHTWPKVNFGWAEDLVLDHREKLRPWAGEVPNVLTLDQALLQGSISSGRKNSEIALDVSHQIGVMLIEQIIKPPIIKSFSKATYDALMNWQQNQLVADRVLDDFDRSKESIEYFNKRLLASIVNSDVNEQEYLEIMGIRRPNNNQIIDNHEIHFNHRKSLIRKAAIQDDQLRQDLLIVSSRKSEQIVYSEQDRQDNRIVPLNEMLDKMSRQVVGKGIEMMFEEDSIILLDDDSLRKNLNDTKDNLKSLQSKITKDFYNTHLLRFDRGLLPCLDKQYSAEELEIELGRPYFD